MKEKDINFIKKTLDLDEQGFETLINKIKELPEDGEECKENYVKDLTQNMNGRDVYEVKKILLTRID